MGASRSMPVLQFSIETTLYASDALQQCLYGAQPPAILLVDMELNELSGIRVCEEVRPVCPRTGIIGITSYPPSRYQARLRNAGAQALLNKTAKLEDIIQTIVTVSQGQGRPSSDFMDTDTAYHTTIQRRQSLKAIHLTAMEQAVCTQYAHHLAPRQIASYLACSTATVYSHKRNILRKIKGTLTWEELLEHFV